MSPVDCNVVSHGCIFERAARAALPLDRTLSRYRLLLHCSNRTTRSSVPCAFIAMSASASCDVSFDVWISSTLVGIVKPVSLAVPLARTALHCMHREMRVDHVGSEL